MPSNLDQRLIEQGDLPELGKKLHKQKKKIVFTAGSWDLLHVGQMRYLSEAKKQGDVLVVGVNGNDAIKKVKGPGKPVMDQLIRAEALTFLDSVDYVTILPEPSCRAALSLLQPDVYVTVSEDWNKGYKNSKEYKIVKEYGGKTVIVDRQSPYISTTTIVERVVGAHLGDFFKKYMKVRKKPLKEK